MVENAIAGDLKSTTGVGMATLADWQKENGYGWDKNSTIGPNACPMSIR
jgi:fructosamine-3-kinase